MKIINRTFNREYQAQDTFDAGIVLAGYEVKSIRAGALRLEDSFVKIMDDGQAYLINAEIPLYQFARVEGYDPRRRRKLLLHKKELLKIKIKLQSSKGLTIAPISCYTKGRMMKLEIALAKGRKDIEKKKLVKARDEKLAEEKEAKEYMKY